MQDVQLTFYNKSNETTNPDIVISPIGSNASSGETGIAWTVIKNCGVGGYHPFTYPLSFQVGASDSWGNYTNRLDASPGQRFEVILDNSGDVLTLSPKPGTPNQIEIANNLKEGAISALIYKDGKLFSEKTGLAPMQMAAFQFAPSIYIGALSQVSEGQVLNTAMLSDMTTKMSLAGLASADIIMTGGGSGPNGTPFEFTLENIQYAS